MIVKDQIFIKIKDIVLLFLVLLLSACARDSDNFVSYRLKDVPFCVIQNRSWNDEIGNRLIRLPDRAKKTLRPVLWELSKHPAGLTIRFKTTANEIQIKYKGSGTYFLFNMPSTAVSYAELFCVDNGSYLRVNGETESSINSSYIFDRGRIYSQRYKHTMGNDVEREFCLYLPLHVHVDDLEIKIPIAKKMTWIPSDISLPIIIYGTSIVQGIAASRPSMSWASIFHRTLKTPVINLGFSGNAFMEKEMLDLIAEIKASLIIFDCCPNMDKENIIENLDSIVVSAVNIIRDKTDIPILLVEHRGFSCSATDSLFCNRMKKTNFKLYLAYQKLVDKKTKNLYYLATKDSLLSSSDWVDHVHPNDIGMERIANETISFVEKFLK